MGTSLTHRAQKHNRKKNYKRRLAVYTKAGPVTVTKADGTVYTRPAYDVNQLAMTLAGGNPRRTGLPSAIRWRVYRRDLGLCRWCGIACGPEAERWEIDHVIPKALGGQDELSNLVLACRRCNQKKRDHLWPLPPLIEHRY